MGGGGGGVVVVVVVVVGVGVGGGRRLTLGVCGPRNVSYIQQTIGQQF